MPTYRTFTVTGLIDERPGLQRVSLDDGSRAYNLTQLTGTVNVGDRVVANTTAVELGLGTGGWHVVHWNLTCDTLRRPGPGHIMKLRYTSLQADTAAWEELDAQAAATSGLGAIPVIVCSLHSQMGVAAASFAAHAPGRRLAYVMTDGAALPLALSDLVHDLRTTGLLCGTVTAGHAFGGDLEAVSIPSALLAARAVLHADAIVIAMGPGVVGTASVYGTTALEAVDLLAWARRLGGTPILTLRASDGDERERHRGISHHTRTVLATVAHDGHAPSTIVATATLRDDVLNGFVLDDADPGTDAQVEALLADRGLRITTMGRGPRADPLFFRTSAAAGMAAALRLAEADG